MTAPTVATVEQVIGYLPTDSDKFYGWDKAKVEEVLEEYEGSLAQCLKRFWYERVSNTHEYISIVEGGTARPLNQIWEHARQMLAYWTQVCDDESGRPPIRFGEIDPTGDC